MRVISRRTFIAGGLVLAATAPAGAASRCPSRRLLFVCQAGTVKSPIARELTRRAAAQRGLKLRVESRGISPEDHVSPQLARALKADRIEPAAEPLRKLTARDLARADTVVVFNPLPAGLGARDVRDWTNVASMNSDYAKARADLAGRIDRLLDEIQSARC